MGGEGDLIDILAWCEGAYKTVGAYFRKYAS